VGSSTSQNPIGLQGLLLGIALLFYLLSWNILCHLYAFMTGAYTSRRIITYSYNIPVSAMIFGSAVSVVKGEKNQNSDERISFYLYFYILYTLSRREMYTCCLKELFHAPTISPVIHWLCDTSILCSITWYIYFDMCSASNQWYARNGKLCTPASLNISLSNVLMNNLCLFCEISGSHGSHHGHNLKEHNAAQSSEGCWLL
jgi:uncharacterized membrane protein YcfT